ncbi:P-loop containing nucleoside triphosphate hydrolase protein [Obba rivulosa]|uniref:P-loop containing nucleoside triphosphate hydrolase protein n=1 Tax=Obba rivulosa TaxID=1052685 RepID=A0A8E2DE53_9APHY|nr:P-loop containing nucleoside triphosphate hydrolase protein [Obba rivulosa]
MAVRRQQLLQGFLDVLDPSSIVIPSAAGEFVRGALPENGDVPQEDTAPEAEPGTVLEVKHLHETLDKFKSEWIAKPAPAEEVEEAPDRSKWAAYAFTVIRRFNPVNNQGTLHNVTTTLQINSKDLVKVGQEAIGQVPGISWTTRPLRIDPQTLLARIPELAEYKSKLTQQLESEPEDSPLHTTLAHLDHLLDYLTATHARTLETLSSLLAHAEITFDLLWAIFIPRKTILYTLCPASGEPRAVRLLNAERCQQLGGSGVVAASHDPSSFLLGMPAQAEQGGQSAQYLWRLTVEYVEVDAGARGRRQRQHEKDQGPEPIQYEDPSAPPQFGYANLGSVLDIQMFQGTKKISDLPIYPLQYYAGPDGVDGLKKRLIGRGKKWATLAGGMHHVSYRGIAVRWKPDLSAYIKYSINSRIMIDRKLFASMNPNYVWMNTVTKTLSGQEIDRHALRSNPSPSSNEQTQLTDDELLLTTPLVYGFSLGDKQWLEFAIEHVDPIQWNNDAFENLVIPKEHKIVLKTLVENHESDNSANFDDFVSGKGLGLVVNLFGNPGTGKSLTAEAMSECLRKPLYVVGAADLGTTADTLDQRLTTIFRMTAVWNAVVLIDEADVFLEERSLHDIHRNAMVAVFLRQLEHFRGILFLTTNRVKVFDEAFQSRIHVSLRYQDLTPDAKRHIWRAFMLKVNGNVPNGGLSNEQLRELGEKKINGRQIKNVVKTASGLAAGGKQQLGYHHIVRVLDLMEEFDIHHSMYQ